MGTTTFTQEQLAEATGGGGGGIIQLGATNTSSSTTTRYLLPVGFTGAAITAIIATAYPHAVGTLSNLNIVLQAAHTDETIVYTVMKNGSPTDLTVTLASGVAAGESTSGTESVVQGDELAVRITKPLEVTFPGLNIAATVGIT
ncbi:MAG: hypothetical protein V3V74_07450 [Nitrosomonadaceae bacterium]